MNRTLSTIYTWGLTGLAFAVLAGGCGVSPELKARLDDAIQKEAELAAQVVSLGTQLVQLTKDFKAGKLDSTTYGEVKDRLEAALAETKDKALDAKLARLEAQTQAKEEGANGWSIAGAVLLNLALRLVGVPGFASAGGGNLATLGRKAVNGGGK